MRRRNSRPWRILLWLAYLLADTTALYTLGHISNSKLPELRPAAFWAQFLLLHLGGQDTMTAYALEDNQLWLRHLLTLVLQAMGAAYLFYRHIADSGKLLATAAVLIYLVGVVKYGERVWTLKSSSLNSISIYLDKVAISNISAIDPMDDDDDPDAADVDDDVVDPEAVLQDAHNLLLLCMGKFVDYKVIPSGPQSSIIVKYCTDGGNLFELTGMQLSLMHDMLYTKVVLIHTWYGCCNRAVSLVATSTSLLLFRLKSGDEGYTGADVAFTYTLLGGAIVVEMISILGAIGSSWTCAIVEGNWMINILPTDLPSWTKLSDLMNHLFQWGANNPFSRSITRRKVLERLHRAVMFSWRLLKSAEHGRKWSGSVGQHNLLDVFTMNQDLISRIARIARPENWLNKSSITVTGTLDIPGGNKVCIFKEIERIVRACDGNEEMMRNYRGQCALRGWDRYSGDPTGWCVDIDFDESILAWHFATNILLLANTEYPAIAGSPSVQQIRDAIKVLSNYLMYLLVEHPHMLPSPVRTRHYDTTLLWLLLVARERPFLSTCSGIDQVKQIVGSVKEGPSGILLRLPAFPPALVRGVTLAKMLLRNNSVDLLRVILGVWVEMLCYVASDCSQDSHARQLSSGAELITVVWILQATMFTYINENVWAMPTDAFFK